MSWPRLVLGAWLLVAGAHAAGPAAGPQVIAGEPRAFGYQVGDLVQRAVTVHVPDGWRLDASTLPRPGLRGQALELRRVGHRAFAEPGGQRHELELEYQVFLAPTVVRTLEIAPLRLRVEGAARTEELRVEAWPVTIAPLVPVEVSPRRGLGELQPDRAPPSIDTMTLRLRLQAVAVAAVLLLAYLAVVYVGPPWLARRRRPFGLAWLQLRGLRADADEAMWCAACQQLHEALNRSAGEVLFEHGLARFVARQPRYIPLRDDIARFLQLSRRQFFGAAGRDPDDATWLVALCRRLRDAERGSL
jgi:mxaA protein